MSNENDERIERIKEVAELLGLSPEQLLIAAAKGGALNVEEIEVEEDQKPPPIVYPNLKFPKYKFREYPKLFYRGYVRDVEEPYLKLVPNEGGGVQQINAVRIIPDQFVMETREVKNRIEETTLPKGWFKTLAEAKEVAIATKAAQRSIEVRDVEAPEKPQRRVAGKRR